VGAELFHTDGRTNRHVEAKSRFSQIGNVPKKHSNENGDAGRGVGKKGI
jgi:hypothetical protein